MTLIIYRVITEDGYAEFKDQQKAIDFAQGSEIQTLEIEVADV